MRTSYCLLVAAVLVLASPQLTYAYVDPGAGSMLLQLLLGGIAGLLVVGRLLKQRIARFLGFGKNRDKN